MRPNPVFYSKQEAFAMRARQALTAVVTGASSGIGKDTVKRLISLDWNVIMISRSVDKMEKIAKSCFDVGWKRARKIEIIGFDLSNGIISSYKNSYILSHIF